jgi:hypothetical protein
MPHRAETLPLAHSRDGTVYLLLDCAADLQTVVADLLSGQYRHPLRVVAFNTADGCARDRAQGSHCAVELDHDLPASVCDFLD